MDSRDNSLNVDVGHLQKIGRKVSRLLKKECKDPIEAMYVLKAILYLLRCELGEAGVVVANKGELDRELTSMIDEAMKEGK